MTASIRLWAGSFTRVPPTSTVGSGAPVSGGSANIVASPSTKSPVTVMDVASPGESDTITSRPVRMLQNVYEPGVSTTTPASSTTRSP